MAPRNSWCWFKMVHKLLTPFLKKVSRQYVLVKNSKHRQYVYSKKSSLAKDWLLLTIWWNFWEVFLILITQMVSCYTYYSATFFPSLSTSWNIAPCQYTWSHVILSHPCIVLLCMSIPLFNYSLPDSSVILHMDPSIYQWLFL